MSPDELQERIVTLKGVRALVLAGPGCGKTHLLTRRIIHANAVEGIPFADMICLTFTNRASREMNARIRAELGYSPDGLFVGNLHRFCSRLLSENSLLPPAASLLDEDDRDSWLSEALGARRRFERKQITDLAMLLFQQEHDFPDGLRRRLDFIPSQPLINAATAYRDYKTENRLVDFDDLLLLAYLHLSAAPPNSLIRSSYRWVQVDEVQDLTPLQLAIIDLITADGPSTVVYLGDEQQAIFEFIGAGGPALDKLKQRCEGQIYRLGRNYRAPDYLVDLCNRFAVTALGLPADRLPKAVADVSRPDDALRLFYASDLNLTNAVSSCVRTWINECPGERIAVLTRTNDEAEDISAVLTSHGLENTLVGRNDLFRRLSYKTVCAHLSAITDPLPSAEWTQLLYRTRAVRNLAEARGLMRRLTELSISPADLLLEKPCSEARQTASARQEFLTSPAVRHIAEKFRAVYSPLYAEARRQLADSTVTIADVADYAYKYLLEREYIKPVARWDAVVAFLRRQYPPTSRLRACLTELRTFNEGDLLDDDLLTVITVHKAKGLEFDNVIIYNVAHRDLPRHADESRVHYVAMSRARRRLALFTTGRPTSDLVPVLNHFTPVSPDTTEALSLLERLHSRPHHK